MWLIKKGKVVNGQVLAADSRQAWLRAPSYSEPSRPHDCRVAQASFNLALFDVGSRRGYGMRFRGFFSARLGLGGSVPQLQEDPSTISTRVLRWGLDGLQVFLILEMLQVIPFLREENKTSIS